jgi:hypothetical protein
MCHNNGNQPDCVRRSEEYYELGAGLIFEAYINFTKRPNESGAIEKINTKIEMFLQRLIDYFWCPGLDRNKNRH